MDKNHQYTHLPIILVVNRFSSQQLARIGQQLQGLPSVPAIKLVKQVPLFPAQFYGLSDASRLERELIQEATQDLLAGLEQLGVRATYQLIRGSHPSQLSLKNTRVIQSMAEFTQWFATLEAEKRVPLEAAVLNY